MSGLQAVSYTHLDVYKRQTLDRSLSVIAPSVFRSLDLTNSNDQRKGAIFRMS